MVIVKLIGGLGNQLFQYAAARALAEKNETSVKLDVSGFSEYQLRNFELEHFNISSSKATVDEINYLKASSSFQRIKERLKPVSSKRFYKQPFFHFDPRFFSLKSPVYIQGYFQSEKYFSNVKKIISTEFTLKNQASAPLNELAGDLQSHQSIALHIRRGDYKNSEAMRVHGVLPLCYYRGAIEKIKTTLKDNAQFYIFSDDPEAAIKELDIPKATLVSGKLTKDHLEDFWLMSKCRHNIIANSSFSWWAAWLNNYQDKIVIAPNQWFANGPKDTQDLIPDEWTKL